MALPNLPIEVPFTGHGQEDGKSGEGPLEGKDGFSQSHRGRKRADAPQMVHPQVAGGRFNENDTDLP